MAPRAWSSSASRDADPQEFAVLQRRFLEIIPRGPRPQTRLFAGMDSVLDALVDARPGCRHRHQQTRLAHRSSARAAEAARAIRLCGERRHRERAQTASAADAARREARRCRARRRASMWAMRNATFRRRMRPACPRSSPPTATCTRMRIGEPGAATVSCEQPVDLLGWLERSERA